MSGLSNLNKGLVGYDPDLSGFVPYTGATQDLDLGSHAIKALTGQIGNQGTEGSGINIGGTTFESSFKVSDIDGTNYAQTILHRHSTILEPLIVGARSNSNTSSHADITAGQGLFTIYGAGWAGSNYKLFGSAQFAADDTGTISNTSAPGKYTINLTPNGSTTPVEVMKITSDKKAAFAGAINEAAYVTVASASTCDIGAAASNNVAISGTTTITSFGTSAAGITRRCRATGAFLITYNGTSLITRNGKNITTKADDCFTMTSLGSGNWLMTDYSTSDGRQIANAINNQTGTTYSFALTDIGNDVTASNGSASTYTLPQTSNVAFPIGSKIKLMNLGAGAITLVKEGSETLVGNTTLAQYATAIIEKISATSWQVFGGTALYPWQIEAARVPSVPVASTTYVIVEKAKSPFTITGFVQSATSLGTAGTYTINIDGTPVTGLNAVTNTTTQTETTATAANSVSAGSKVTITFSGTIATPVGWSGSLSITQQF